VEVVGGRTHLQSQEGQSLPLVEAPGDAEVEQGHRPVPLDQQVAPVEITVEHPVEEGPLQEGDEAGPQHGGGVDAGRPHAGGVAPGEAVQVLHHQHPPGHQLGVGPGHHDRALARAGEDRRDVQHVLGLEPEVELLHDGLGEQLHQGRGIGQGRHRDPAHQLGGDPRHGGDVQPHQTGHRPALHLDHDPFAGPQGGRVDLGDGGRGDGDAVEGREHLGQRFAQILFHRATHRGEGLGRDAVPQQLELLDQLLGEDALAGRDDLAQLDVGRAEALEGRTQPA
jgi:hypothetical protein